jgi:hypothetical protein
MSKHGCANCPNCRTGLGRYPHVTKCPKCFFPLPRATRR